MDLTKISDLDLIEVTMDAAAEINKLEQIKRAAEMELARRVQEKKKAENGKKHDSSDNDGGNGIVANSIIGNE